MKTKSYEKLNTTGDDIPFFFCVRQLLLYEKLYTMKQLLKFIVLYASGLGTFCLYFFGVLSVEPTAPMVGLITMGIILAGCSIMGMLNLIMHIEEKLQGA
jgi:hypothetical protein